MEGHQVGAVEMNNRITAPESRRNPIGGELGRRWNDRHGDFLSIAAPCRHRGAVIGHFHVGVWRSLHSILFGKTVWMKLDEVRLHRRVEESLVGRRGGTGIDFLHDDDVLALEGRKEEDKLAADIMMRCKKNSDGRWTDVNCKGKERRGMVLLFVSL